MKNCLSLVLIALFLHLCSFAQNKNHEIIALLQKEPDEEIDVLCCEEDWEQQLDFGTILKVGDKYIMYYRAISHNAVPHELYCYATSDDGINWVKTKTGVFNYRGSYDNNIITDRVDGVSVDYVDSTYYMLVDRVYDENNEMHHGLGLYKSKDGIVFERDSAFDIPFFCDTQNQLMWDSTSRTFKLYLRSWYDSKKPLIKYSQYSQYRSVSLLETPTLKYSLKPGKDARHFTDLKVPSINKELPVVFENTSATLDYDIYGAYVNKYRDDLYIAYPINYYHTPSVKNGGQYDNDGYGTIGMWVSNDGRTFKEIERDYITNGENWIETCIGHVETDSTFIHYYIPFNNTHAARPIKKNTIRARIHYKTKKSKQ